MRCTESRVCGRVRTWSMVVGVLLGLAGCQTTTQRCMEERDACRKACESKAEGQERNTCNDACDDGLNECMAE